MFGNTPIKETGPFKNKSNFCPNISDPLIQAFEKVVTRDLIQLETTNKPCWSNITKAENHALNTLAADTSIIIKEADKGGRIVILNKQDYMQEIHRQLTDTTFYEILPVNPSKHITLLIHTVVEEACTLGYITEQMAKFLIQKEPRISLFYLLPQDT